MSSTPTARRISEVESGSDAERTPGPDATFELLADDRRRYALYYLRECTYPADLHELAEHVAARELDAGHDAVPDEAWKRVLASLVHSEVPELEAAGVVEYDRESRMVVAADATAQFDRILEVAAALEDEH